MGYHVMVLVLLLITSSYSDVVINCFDEHFISSGMRKARKENPLCIAKIDDYPWNNRSETAPKPDNMAAETIIIKNRPNKTRHIAVRLIWRQKRVEVIKYVEGYHLELNHIEPQGSATQYIFNLSSSLYRRLTNLTDPYVTFIYIYGRDPEYIAVRPRYEYILKLQSMPIYNEKDNPLIIRENLSVPDCRSIKIKKTEECKEERKDKGPQRNKKKVGDSNHTGMLKKQCEYIVNEKESVKSSNAPHIVIGCLCGALAIIGVVLSVILKKKLCHVLRHKTETDNKDEIVVLIISTTDDYFIPEVNFLIEILKKVEGVSVIANLRENVEIGNEGMLKWTKDNMEGADLVVFMPANPYDFPSERRIEEEDYIAENSLHRGVANGLFIADEWIVSKKIPKPNRKFIMADLNKCAKGDQNIFCKHYALPSGLQEFLKQVLGKRVNYLEKKDLKKFTDLLSCKQLGHQLRKMSRDDTVNPMIPLFMNNLDLTSGGLNDDMDPPNIPIDGPSSYDSNPSAPYVTTDFNDERETHHMPKYCGTGARPKV